MGRRWRTYAVTVDGFEQPMTVSAPTASKARYDKWLDFTDVNGCTFKEFLKISHVRTCDAPPRESDGYGYVRRAYSVDPTIGQRVRLRNEGRSSGLEGEVVYPGPSTAHVHVAIDGRDHAVPVHPMNVELLETADG